jgi:L-asparaginase
MKVPQKKKKILMLFCGGTIAMIKNAQGSLEPGLKPEQLYSMAPKIKEHADIDVQFITDIDSTNMTSAEWLKMINAINENMYNYDAFLLTHGTDTMAETANAIALAFGSTLAKPVIITGSQAAPHELGSDATTNMERAVLAAITTRRPEVMISFHDNLYRGVRTQKRSERKLDAFSSPVEMPVAEYLGGGIQFLIEDSERIQTMSRAFLPFFNEQVIAISLHAASDAQHISETLLSGEGNKKIQGLVWTSLGAGNIPELLYPTIVLAEKKSIPIVVVSQYPGGRLNMLAYESGRKALELGVIPAGDMTPEAAVTKLKWALGLAMHKGIKPSEIPAFVDHIFHHNRANEITIEKSSELPLPL